MTKEPPSDNAAASPPLPVLTGDTRSEDPAGLTFKGMGGAAAAVTLIFALLTLGGWLLSR